MAAIDRFMIFMSDPRKLIGLGLGKELFDLFSSATLIAFQRQHIVSTTLDNVGRDMSAAMAF